ncbi:MAG: Uma2 family endonuclease [Bacillota bacterium]
MEVASTEVQNNFGTYLKLAQVEEVFITRNGKRIAVLRIWEEPCNAAESKTVYRTEHPRMSAEEFLKLSEASENRYELIDGEVYQLASPSYEHQRIIGELFSQIYQWAKGKKCKPVTSPFDIRVQKDDNLNVVQPDIVIICDYANIDEQGKYNGVPTLVIEVLSDATRHKDMLKKLNLYMCGGIREYWIVNPANREAYVYSFESGEIGNYRVFKGTEGAASEALEDLVIRLEQVFAAE